MWDITWKQTHWSEFLQNCCKHVVCEFSFGNYTYMADTTSCLPNFHSLFLTNIMPILWSILLKCSCFQFALKLGDGHTIEFWTVRYKQKSAKDCWSTFWSFFFSVSVCFVFIHCVLFSCNTVLRLKLEQPSFDLEATLIRIKGHVEMVKWTERQC